MVSRAGCRLEGYSGRIVCFGKVRAGHCYVMRVEVMVMFFLDLKGRISISRVSGV
jgi:hypothetical protein